MAVGRDGIAGAFCIRDLANAITEKREVDDEEGGRERQKTGI